ncbi:protein phosphatase 2C 37-like [Cynara cardunculus var. scolymus]|uniref:protein-serine/threonine phosphatase n=1 Tax=Cynara cardunculus var. scolymus TaxID=59895 RepID=A0A103YIU8_CYNCS|nr:protein phosphatase 2C 37-like [Cynara cardunculus var. scolymus]KVI09878.1 Protein phosphatase 2C [Cynara cardunculus var. scolymus]
MAGMCCGVVGETNTPSTVEHSGGRQGRRRRMEIQQLKFLAAAASDVVMPLPGSTGKRRKVESLDMIQTSRSGGDIAVTTPEGFENAVQACDMKLEEVGSSGTSSETKRLNRCGASLETLDRDVSDEENSRFGLTVVCGRRRDLEDAVAVKPSFCKTSSQNCNDLHFYGVYDGHGCSHVAMKCKDRMHEIVKEEVENGEKSMEWKQTMVKSFSRMDKDVTEWSNNASSSNCRCELQTPQCDAVGSTAVVAVVTPDKIVVSNCGDSRAVLCRNGVAIPLSSDHKPDRPDELERIEEAGGRVIYWDGARVLGVLAMSRAIGDNYLKPYVIPEPEVTVTERTAEDECLILASDGLWDVVSNDVACSVARMCLSSQDVPSPPRSPGSELNVARGESSDKACSDASILLTKLALARRSTDNVSVVVVDLRRTV